MQKTAARNLAFLSSLLLTVTSFSIASDTDDLSVPEITVLGKSSKKKSVTDYVPTVSEISGRKLDKKKESTLGETLAREAGVTSTFYGPNASRPVIRGLDGERVRLLQGGLSLLDASGTSPDHAVAGDPLLLDRVEIVRGSAALLYGSSAIGGVVNTITSRIPDRLNYASKVKFESRLSSVDAGRSAGLLVNHNAGKMAYHLDGIVRGSHDYRTPFGTVANSANNSFEGALGTSYVGDFGYFGGSLTTLGTHYGTAAAPDVTIDLNRQRFDFAGEFRGDGLVESTKISGAASYYKHQELEGDEIGTTFRNRGAELRADFKHRGLGSSEGIFGFQQQLFALSALGAEAFIPTTQNLQSAVFAHEEWNLGKWKPTFGLRLERASVHSDGGDNFGEATSQTFWTPSLSAGTLYDLDGVNSIGLNVSLTERAPNYQELFANGPHMATGIFERGSTSLGSEIGRSLELSLRRKGADSEGRFGIFAQDFTRFIALIPSGETDPTDNLPIHEFRSISAMIAGAEFEFHQKLPWSLWDGVWEWEARLDFVRGLNRTDSTNLPRITPLREGLALNYRTNAFAAELELQRSEAQGILAPNETPTNAYTFVNLSADAPVTTSFGTFRVLGKLTNLLDAEARNHVSVLKDLAPLPGRNVVVGLQARL